jgi:hypothetical protein
MIRAVSKGLLLIFILAVSGLGPGCNPLPSEKRKMVDVPAEYLGLAGQRVAVMVAADGRTLSEYRDAPLRLSQAVTSRIAEHVPGIRTTVPDEVIRFQEANPYWMNLRYGELAEKMGVDKVVLIDLVEYRTHEPGNAYLWQGIITANIGVIDAHAQDPDNFVYYSTVQAHFPRDNGVGVVDADNESIQLGMIILFSQTAGGLFYDHQAEVK